MKMEALSEQALDQKCVVNDTEALFEKGRRLYLAGETAAAKKYFIFARQLGSSLSCGFLGYLYEREGDNARAEQCYRDGCRGGDLYSTFRYACVIINENFDEAVELLAMNAAAGHGPSAERLSRIYEKLGDTANSDYYANLADGIKTRTMEPR